MSNKVSDADKQHVEPVPDESHKVDPEYGQPKHDRPKKGQQPIDKKEPGSPFLLAAVSYMFVLILALALFTLIRLWWLG